MTRTYDSAQHLLSLQRPGLLTPDLESNPYDFSSSRFDHYREPNGHHHQRCHYCPASVNPKPAPTSASASTSNSHATAANGATSNTVTAQAQPKRRAAPPVVPRPPSIVPRTTLSIGLTLASMLPPLATLRRPSKAAIVRTSIATVNASRRHCVLAAQTLRALEGGGEFEGRTPRMPRADARPVRPHPPTPPSSARRSRTLTSSCWRTASSLRLEEEDEEELQNGDNNNKTNEGAWPVPPQNDH
ncbi:hypothetical protein DFH06DRAFT_1479201 [Mycena polygramma]|nr:hypothetical protein DFH06DRAFT_1479201 [Mycena polygramma]